MSIIADGCRLKVAMQDAATVFLKNIPRDSYAAPFALSVQIAFEAPALDAAEAVGAAKLASFLNALVLATGAAVRLTRTRAIIDYSEGLIMRTALIWNESTRYLKNPEPVIGPRFAATMTKLLSVDVQQAVARALRWYRLGVRETLPGDQYQYFWFALEILAEHLKPSEKVASKCSHCQNPLYCYVCRGEPTHAPFAKQAIEHLIKSIAPSIHQDMIQAFFTTRHTLLHGATFSEVELKPKFNPNELLDTLARIVRAALIRQVPPSVVGDGLHLGELSTYQRRSVGAVATISSMWTFDADGAVEEQSLRGMQFSIEPNGPPQSERIAYVVLTSELFDRVSRGAFTPGNQEAICRRIFDGRQKHREQLIAPVFSADLVKLRAQAQLNDADAWTELCKDLLAVVVLPALEDA